MMVVDFSHANHAAVKDGVRLQIIQNGLMSYIISILRSSSTDISIRFILAMLLKLLSKPSQHFSQIQQSFRSSGGVQVLDNVFRRLGQEDEALVRRVRGVVWQILQQIQG